MDVNGYTDPQHAPLAISSAYGLWEPVVKGSMSPYEDTIYTKLLTAYSATGGSRFQNAVYDPFGGYDKSYSKVLEDALNHYNPVSREMYLGHVGQRMSTDWAPTTDNDITERYAIGPFGIAGVKPPIYRSSSARRWSGKSGLFYYLSTLTPAEVETSVDRGTAQMNSATWFAPAQADPAAVDYESGALKHLKVSEPALLKLALSDRPFHNNPEKKSTLTTNPVTGLPAGAKLAGTKLDVTFYCESFDPPRATATILVPQAGEQSVVSFRVVPKAFDLGGVTVYLQLKWHDSVFYQIQTSPVVLPSEGASASPAADEKASVAIGSYNMLSNAQALAKDDVDLEFGVALQQDKAHSTIITWKDHADPVRHVDDVARGGTSITYAQEEDMRKTFSKAIEELVNKDSESHWYDGEEISSGTEFRRDALRLLAYHGQKLHKALFANERLKPILDRIRESSLERIEKGQEPIRISVRDGPIDENEMQPRRMMVPLGLLYDDPKFNFFDSSSEPDAKGFWDYRYVIEYDEYGMSGDRSSLCQYGPIRTAAALDKDAQDDSWKDQIKLQTAAFVELERTKSGFARRTSIRRPRSFESFFKASTSMICFTTTVIRPMQKTR